MPTMDHNFSFFTHTSKIILRHVFCRHTAAALYNRIMLNYEQDIEVRIKSVIV